MVTKKELQEYTDKELAVRYQCSVRTVQRWRKKMNVNRPGWGPRKLNMEVAREIRRRYFGENLTQQQLAKMYRVSQAAIGRVVNNITYPEKKFGFGGESPCMVQYKVG
jgi:hypothetical protein